MVWSFTGFVISNTTTDDLVFNGVGNLDANHTDTFDGQCGSILNDRYPFPPEYIPVTDEKLVAPLIGIVAQADLDSMTLTVIQPGVGVVAQLQARDAAADDRADAADPA